MQKEFKRLTTRVAKKRIFKKKTAESQTSFNSANLFISSFSTQSVSLLSNISNSNVSASFLSDESIQSYNSLYSSFSSASEVVQEQSAFAQFQNSSSSVVQSMQSQQNAFSKRAAQSKTYNQFNAQSINVDQPESQNTTLSDTQMLFVKAQSDAHTRFLSTLMSMKKTYEIPDSIITKSDQTDLSKKINQADQESEMNVITSNLVRKLILDVMPLSQLKFQRMTMMTTNHKETSLTSFVCFDFISEEISKAIKCFVEPETYDK